MKPMQESGAGGQAEVCAVLWLREERRKLHLLIKVNTVAPEEGVRILERQPQ